MRVYLVMWYDCGKEDVKGVYTKKEEAQEYIENCKWKEDYWISEYDLLTKFIKE